MNTTYFPFFFGTTKRNFVTGFMFYNHFLPLERKTNEFGLLFPSGIFFTVTSLLKRFMRFFREIAPTTKVLLARLRSISQVVTSPLLTHPLFENLFCDLFYRQLYLTNFLRQWKIFPIKKKKNNIGDVFTKKKIHCDCSNDSLPINLEPAPFGIFISVSNHSLCKF